MSNFPTSLDNSSSLPNPTGISTQASPDHASLHVNENSAIIAAETKLGIGASTPTSTMLLRGTGVGTSAWDKVAPTGTIVGTTDSQTLTNKILTSPTINTPNITNATITADTISGFSSASTGTIYGMSVTAGILASAALVNTVNTAAIQTNAITNDKVATGFSVQTVSSNFNTYTTGTTLIPYDDTIPQITEGTEIMTKAITPKSATNRLRIEVTALVACTVVTDIIVALFQDATANALAVEAFYSGTAFAETTLHLMYDMVAGTTSATTFRIRLGGSVAGTYSAGGSSSTRKFGGATTYSITITEYKA